MNIHLGKRINKRKYEKIIGFLVEILPKDEEVLAYFSANRVRTPATNGIVFTKKRILMINSFGSNIEISEEIAADELLKIESEKAFGSGNKVVIYNKNKKKIFKGIMIEEDIYDAKNLLSKMSGAPPPITERRANRLNTTLYDVSIQAARQALEEDRIYLIEGIVKAIIKHWDVLEDKLLDATKSDEYGVIYVDISLKVEAEYFYNKVILPELDSRVTSGNTTYGSVAFILADIIQIIGGGPLEGVSVNQTEHEMAENIFANLTSRVIDDDLLLALVENPDSMQTYLNEVHALLMEDRSITLSFVDDLKTSEPIQVTPIVALIILIITSIQNTKNTTNNKIVGSYSSEYKGNDPYEYERHIKKLLRSQGFHAQKTSSTGDFGVDVIAEKDGFKYAIQCKLYNRTVGSKSVQEVNSGKLYYDADYAIVVSDNSFTKAAKELARKTDVILVHHDNLLSKIEKVSGMKNETTKINKQKQHKPQSDEDEKMAITEEVVTVILPTIRNDK